MQVAKLPQAKKRFGQNFLVQPAIVSRIVAVIAPRPGDALVEIGPGPGALTQALLAAQADGTGPLRVIELDRDLLPNLHALATPEQLQVIAGDALQVDFVQLATEAGAALRVVGNLPYNISTPLLFHLLAQKDAIVDMHFMLQKEVADRLAAGPGSSAYGRLSLMVQAQAQVEVLFPVAPGNFRPVPKVDSAFVRLSPCRPSRLPSELLPHFTRAVSLAFAQRRKTLANNFKGILDSAMLEALAISPSARAETLDFTTFVRLAEALAQKGATS
ncbi:16S rRNA (adenine(1518)-N(6)/adenine(1519)-N(6))-dimethyltransferase RsmA [Acidithiobacillus sp. AMEEHan]|uniref:16S rRNA (adenine(1518)-N(6)/adenine(1519)-N(6))- dimethyltransferase RsmA n=1 Tax=Acidithiobacillus sp. AMEEHan TaxID=2994951 RepID=UPI0027E3F637|nr:16S rRNA (adenine(1518)-N(6)/adenine(1519)-N(6))-dimethyltransferase RsmA [Acidithiobacillus sp. AMEEHan]